MKPGKWSFLVLALGEIPVVLAGQVSVPGAVVLQVMIPVVLFRRYLGTGREFLATAAGFALLTIAFSGVLLSGRHVLAPLIVLACIGLLAIFLATVAHYRIGRRYGGAA